MSNQVCEGLSIDPRSRDVRVDGQYIELTPHEYDLLVVLAEDPLRVVPRRELYQRIWGIVGLRTRTLDVSACKLRVKLNATGRRYILTRRGIGYQLIDTTADLPKAGAVYEVDGLLFESLTQAERYAAFALVKGKVQLRLVMGPAIAEGLLSDAEL